MPNVASRNFLLIIAALVLIVLAVSLLITKQSQVPPSQPQSKTTASPKTTAPVTSLSTSAKGVVSVETPQPEEETTSPLLVTGFVYGKKGQLTIRLKQKESGQYVIEDKVITISGAADKISFAESIQFGLPARPQVGILEVIYKDLSDQGLDDSVSVEVNFPTDLGRGE